MRHLAGGLEPARPPRRALHRREQPEEDAGDAAPGDLRFARALRRHPARALCGPSARLARAGAGGGDEYQRKAGKLRGRGRRIP